MTKGYVLFQVMFYDLPMQKYILNDMAQENYIDIIIAKISFKF